MKKKLMTLMMGTLLLLTACGQTGSNSTSTMLPVAAVQSAAQAIAPVEDKAQEDVDSLPAEEDTEQAEPTGGKENSKPANDAETPSGKTEETPSAPAETPPPTAPEELATPALVPEDKPAPAPTPAPAQKPAEKQEEEPAPAPTPEPAPMPEPEPAPEPVPALEPKPEPADRWAAVSAANAYAVTQYGVITDGSLTLDNSAYRFPAAVPADASQETLEAKARDMVDYTFRQLMMQAGMDSIADAGFHYNVCIVEDGASLLIYVLYAG